MPAHRDAAVQRRQCQNALHHRARRAHHLPARRERHESAKAMPPQDPPATRLRTKRHLGVARGHALQPPPGRTAFEGRRGLEGVESALPVVEERMVRRRAAPRRQGRGTAQPRHHSPATARAATKVCPRASALVRVRPPSARRGRPRRPTRLQARVAAGPRVASRAAKCPPARRSCREGRRPPLRASLATASAARPRRGSRPRPSRSRPEAKAFGHGARCGRACRWASRGKVSTKLSTRGTM